MPVTDTATSTPSRVARAARHRRGGLGRDRAVLGSTSAGTPSSRLLHLVRVRDDRAEEDVARPRDRGQPGRDEPAGARLRGPEREPALPAQVEHDLLHGALVAARTGTARAARGAPPRARRRAPPRPARRRGRRGSRSPARRSSPPRRPRLRPRPRAPSRPPTRSRRRSAARGGRAARRGRATRCTGSVSSARGHSRWSSTAGRAARPTTRPSPGRARGRAPCPRARARPRRPGSVACLRTPAAKSAYGRRAARRPRARPPRSPSRAPRRREVEPERRRDELDRPVVVRRAEAARDDAQRRPADPRRAPPRARSGGSPTIEIRAGSRPSEEPSRARNGPFRSVRSPRTSSLPVTTIAARGRRKRLCVTVG